MVKKGNGKWRMCIDYTDLNKACPKDTYPLLNIDRFVEMHRDLSFLVSSMHIRGTMRSECIILMKTKQHS